ncbi:MAG: macrolide ABC transporter ATP-binding protein, partial [Clostridia bacterium]|nr:macrolide ABC transporter ATP-binding protein [Clostridia bacterium]
MERCVWRLIKKMKKPFIQANNIWKIYYMGEVEVPAIRGISLEIEKGEFIAII